jgi:hypothetical protein
MAVEYRSQHDTDWWSELDKEEQKDIDEAVLQAKTGQTSTHDQVMARMQKKFPQLKFS